MKILYFSHPLLTLILGITRCTRGMMYEYIVYRGARKDRQCRGRVTSTPLSTENTGHLCAYPYLCRGWRWNTASSSRRTTAQSRLVRPSLARVVVILTHSVHSGARRVVVWYAAFPVGRATTKTGLIRSLTRDGSILASAALVCTLSVPVNSIRSHTDCYKYPENRKRRHFTVNFRMAVKMLVKKLGFTK
jgi:hypothetical protein